MAVNLRNVRQASEDAQAGKVAQACKVRKHASLRKLARLRSSRAALLGVLCQFNTPLPEDVTATVAEDVTLTLDIMHFSHISNILWSVTLDSKIPDCYCCKDKKTRDSVCGTFLAVYICAMAVLVFRGYRVFPPNQPITTVLLICAIILFIVALTGLIFSAICLSKGKVCYTINMIEKVNVRSSLLIRLYPQQSY
ncbi:hypothetical protein MAR_021029 [Mya arenaria]|uniref:Uncharacterized protein n=1 Tax=Mya arenaria TaxID=6604 RepID=A0ABY7E6J4_MYAAR|nr:hypothetical protein MAR_021029 [Mya arenaria]